MPEEMKLDLIKLEKFVSKWKTEVLAREKEMEDYALSLK